MKVVAIHQPNFLPWLGYFHKMVHCDTFVFLDSVQHPKTGGCWTQRMRLLISGEARWMSVPVDRSYHGTRAINETQIKESEPWRKKFLTTVSQSYRRTPHFKLIFPVVEGLIEYSGTNLAEFNLNGIRRIWEMLTLPPREFILSSDCLAKGSSNELLIELTKEQRGTHYLCGGGSSGYQDDALFTSHGLNITYQFFKHPHYSQVGVAEMVSGLSIVDALFNIGPEATRGLLLGQPLATADEPAKLQKA